MYVAIFLAVVPKELLASGNLSPSQTKAATGAVAAIYIFGFSWAMGWNSFQYLVNAEVYPIRLRALGSLSVMCFHFVNQFGSTKAVPTMLLDMHTCGFFAFWTCVCLTGLAWVWFFIPETRGKSLESMDALFSLPWHQIGRHRRELTKVVGSHADAEETSEKVQAINIGNVRKV